MNSNTDFEYLSGFDNYFLTEVINDAVPRNQNSPQTCSFGLYTEQLSGSAFTAPRKENYKSWLYRIHPPPCHPPFQKYAGNDLFQTDFSRNEMIVTPNQIRWDPITDCIGEVDFIDSITTLAGQGNPRERMGLAIHLFAFNVDMLKKVFSNSDGDFLIIPYEGVLVIQTEMGMIRVKVGEIAVLQRGIKYAVFLDKAVSKQSKGYVLEIFDRHFELPELGPIGANGLADPQHFQHPIAYYEHIEAPYIFVNKYGGCLFHTKLKYSPFDVVGWKGNYSPYKYDLDKFSVINTALFDHPDPSIFTVLTVKSAFPGTALADFVIFPPRWMVAEHTFRPPWFHRNPMSEYMGLIRGNYDAKKSGFLPGGGSLHSICIAHGPDNDVVKEASSSELIPKKTSDSLAFMFESFLFLDLTKAGHEGVKGGGLANIQSDYYKCWDNFEISGPNRSD